MIITRIYGGLGNQMFQYAIGRVLANKHGTESAMDITGFQNYPLRHYELGCFRLPQRFATAEEIARVKGKDPTLLSRVLGRIVGRSLGTRPPTYYREASFSFDPEIFSAGDTLYLEGYWQSEKYFSSIANVIRQDFHFAAEPDEKNAQFLQRIRSSEAVSIHVRRGDYVSDKKTNQFHGTTSMEYYQRAVRAIRAVAGDPTLFIFSDDAEWVKAHLHFDAETVYVDHNGPDKGYEDLRLMSNCRHHIITNSTFSWWGAWLAEWPRKKIIAPLKWFTNDTDTSDLIPPSWERIA